MSNIRVAPGQVWRARNGRLVTVVERDVDYWCRTGFMRWIMQGAKRYYVPEKYLLERYRLQEEAEARREVRELGAAGGAA